MLDLRLGRWRCLNEQCSRKTFVERLPSVAAPMARRTVRVAEIVRLFGHAAGGLPSERLLARLAMPVSDNAILRQLKRHVRERADPAPLRAIAIDDWSWRKGFTYGTIVVDLERRTVADVLETRSAKETADWLERRPEIEIVSRDRCGLYAQGHPAGRAPGPSGRRPLSSAAEPAREHRAADDSGQLLRRSLPTSACPWRPPIGAARQES